MTLESLIINSIKNYKIKKNNEYYKKEQHIEDYDYIANIHYNDDIKFLSFEIKHYHKEPKIGRYVQVNYNRTPVYEGYKERTSIVKKFNKSINLIRFMEEDIFKLNLCEDDLCYITSKILEKNDSYCPSWMKKKMDIESVGNRIKSIKENNEIIRKNKSLIIEEMIYEDKKLNELNDKLKHYKTLPKKPSSKWMLFFGILFSPIFIGIIIIWFYVSPRQAHENKKLELDFLKKYPAEKQKIILTHNMYINKIDLEDNKIKFNDGIIDNLLNEIDKISETNYREVQKDDEGFINLRESCNLIFNDIKKGVYVIWNKTKNMYYVGQSKDVYKRLFKQHFNNGEVKNIIFARHWYDNDNFFYKIIFCHTKDELDNLEKKLIEEFDSFESGYNKTGGNK